MTNPATGQPSIGDLVDDYIAEDATRDVSGRPGKAVPLLSPDDDERQRGSGPGGQPPIDDLVDDYIAQDATRDVSSRPGKAVPLVTPDDERQRPPVHTVQQPLGSRGPGSPPPSTAAPTSPPLIGILVDDYIAQDATRDVSSRPGKVVPLLTPVVGAAAGRGPVPTASTGGPTGGPPLGDLVDDRPRRWWLLVAVLLLAIGGIAGAVVALEGGNGHTPPTTTTTTVPPTTTTTTVPPTTTTTTVPPTTTTTTVPPTTTTTTVPPTTTTTTCVPSFSNPCGG